MDCGAVIVLTGMGLVVGVWVSWSVVGTGRKMITSAIRGESPSSRW